MDSGNRIKFIKIIISILQVIKKVFDDFINLFLLEAELAKRSIKRLIFSAILLLMMIVSVWMLGMCMLVFYLHSFGFSLWLSFLAIILAHIIVAIVALLILLKTIPNLSFSVTRKQLLMLKK